MVDLGIYFPLNSTEAGDSRIKYIATLKSHYVGTPWPQWIKDKIAIWFDTYTEDKWGYYKTPQIYRKGMMNIEYIKWRFQIATERKDDYDYGMFLLMEEAWNPMTLVGGQWASWRVNYSDWIIDGVADLGGQHIEALKPWYTRVKGAWNQAWWDNLKATNSKSDSTINQFCNEYYFKLHKAWVQHMHSLGKKAACGGLMTLDGLKYLNSAGTQLYGTLEIFNWVCQNYDWISMYAYPMCNPPSVPCESTTDYRYRPLTTVIPIAGLSDLRTRIKGIFAWNLTGEFLDGYGSGNKNLQYEEYKRVLPYVNQIFSIPYADKRTNPTTTNLMAPRLLEFCSSTSSCSGSTPPPTQPPTQTPPPIPCPAPTVSFIYSPLSPVANEAIEFTDTSSAGQGESIYRWLWEFGSSTNQSSSRNPAFIFPTPGSYNVKLTVWSTCGTTGILQKTIQIGEASTPPPVQCNPDTEIFLPSIGCVPKSYLVYGGLGFALLMLLR